MSRWWRSRCRLISWNHLRICTLLAYLIWSPNNSQCSYHWDQIWTLQITCLNTLWLHCWRWLRSLQISNDDCLVRRHSLAEWRILAKVYDGAATKKLVVPSVLIAVRLMNILRFLLSLSIVLPYICTQLYFQNPKYTRTRYNVPTCHTCCQTYLYNVYIICDSDCHCFFKLNYINNVMLGFSLHIFFSIHVIFLFDGQRWKWWLCRCALRFHINDMKNTECIDVICSFLQTINVTK